VAHFGNKRILGGSVDSQDFHRYIAKIFSVLIGANVKFRLVP